jgi:hypothetical protein
MLSALAHRMLRDHVHLWITFVFVNNTCVSLDITKTSPQENLVISLVHTGHKNWGFPLSVVIGV